MDDSYAGRRRGFIDLIEAETKSEHVLFEPSESIHFYRDGMQIGGFTIAGINEAIERRYVHRFVWNLIRGMNRFLEAKEETKVVLTFTKPEQSIVQSGN